MIYAIAAVCLFGKALAEVPTWNCSDVSYLENINKTRFMGKWYSVEITKPVNGTDCGSMNLVVEDGLYWVIFEHQVLPLSGGSNKSELDVSKFNVTDEKGQLEDTFFTEDFRIVPTDYTSYAVSTLCDETFTTVVILTRDSHPTEEVLTKAREMIRKKVGNVKLIARNQSGCRPDTHSSNYNMKIQSRGLIG